MTDSLSILSSPFNCVSAIGDVADSACWSGIPYHFYRAARQLKWSVEPCRLNLADYRWRRWRWNLAQILRGRGRGGYQYSASFLAQAEADVLSDCAGRTILSFHHHFPRAKEVKKAGGRVIYYLDATLAAELDGFALSINLPLHARKEALRIERENLAEAEHVVTMGRWLSDYLIERKMVAPERLSVVMPGANIELPLDWSPSYVERKSKHSFVLGLVGNDWRRKGLPFLIEIARAMQRRGVNTRIMVVGNCPSDIAVDCVDVIGPVNKITEQGRFIELLQKCDIGCLFSEKEALGISILEFLRMGVPVAGFVNEGPADTIPPDAGFRFSLGETAQVIADRFVAFARDEEMQLRLRQAAIRWSPYVTWDRCLMELSQSLTRNIDSSRIRPWMGLSSISKKL